MKVTAAILAGGKSQRMGRDKAGIVLANGVTFLQRTVALAADVCEDVIVVGRERPSDWPFAQTTFLPDEIPGAGPAGGLLTALRHSSGPILLLACDMPALTADALRWLRERAALSPHTPGIAAVQGEQVEPLFALYRPACLPALEQRLAAGRRSLQGLLAALPFVFTEVPAPHRPALANINTPEELSEALGVCC